MPELFIELLSEEIPARMQRSAAADFERLLIGALAPIHPRNPRTWCGPRRIALQVEVAAAAAATRITERGPRIRAPEQALAGFVRKHGVDRDQLRRDGDYWVVDHAADAEPAASLIASAVPA